jgi:hypothetical protein
MPSTSPADLGSATAAWSRYAPAWLGAAALGVANGVGRRALCDHHLRERAADQVSTLTLIALLVGRLWSLVLLWLAVGPLVVREELARCPDHRAP